MELESEGFFAHCKAQCARTKSPKSNQTAGAGPHLHTNRQERPIPECSRQRASRGRFMAAATETKLCVQYEQACGHVRTARGGGGGCNGPWLLRGYRAIKAATNNSFERATDWLSDTWTLLRAPSHPSTTRTGKRTPPNAKSGHNNLHPFEMKGETTPSSAGAEFAPAPLHTQQREANPQTETKTNGKHP